MIGKLTGVVDIINTGFLILDVNGVGYLVHCHDQLMRKISLGDKISLYIETQVREQDISLFGFKNQVEQTWFQKLISVQGVGSKLSISILGAIGPEDLRRAIIMDDKARLEKISGIGGKIATRIINELKNKIKGSKGEYSITTETARQQQSLNLIAQDAIEALISLGFNKADATSKVENIMFEDPQIELESLIKKALRCAQ